MPDDIPPELLGDRPPLPDFTAPLGDDEEED